MMAAPMTRITYSTKYACQEVDPAKRDLRPAREGRLSSRITMRVRMPSVVRAVMKSTYISYGSQLPTTGRSQSALKSWP